MVYVIGDSGARYVTLAYDASLTAVQWFDRYRGPGRATDIPYALALSPDGSQVSVTGYSAGVSGFPDYGTVTYDALTGDRLWIARYGSDQSDIGHDLGYSPDGTRLFVTGESWNIHGDSGVDYVTVEYDAATGRQLWAQRQDGPLHEGDTADALAVSPDGTRLFVTGWMDTTFEDPPPTDFGTVAYTIP
jgi:DNA-binding beta-propeller fold protein YncE